MQWREEAGPGLRMSVLRAVESRTNISLQRESWRTTITTNHCIELSLNLSSFFWEKRCCHCHKAYCGSRLHWKHVGTRQQEVGIDVQCRSQHQTWNLWGRIVRRRKSHMSVDSPTGESWRWEGLLRYFPSDPKIKNGREFLIKHMLTIRCRTISIWPLKSASSSRWYRRSFITSGIGKWRRNGNLSTQYLPTGKLLTKFRTTCSTATTSGSEYWVGVVFP